MSTKYVCDAISQWAAQSGIRDLHLHDLRREFGSRLMESGTSLQDVRELLGHADISQTSAYLESTPRSREAAVIRMERQQDAARKARQAAAEQNSHNAAECDNGQPLAAGATARREVPEQ